MAAPDGMKPMTSNYTKDGDPCPPEYVSSTHYRANDLVSLLDPPTGGGYHVQVQGGRDIVVLQSLPPRLGATVARRRDDACHHRRAWMGDGGDMRRPVIEHPPHAVDG